jgi:hypothetical protein
MKTMSVGRRILGVVMCLFLYAGGVALDLYNAARFKEPASLYNEKGELMDYSVYGNPELHCIDGLDIFEYSVGLALLLLPLLMCFAVKRDRISVWHKMLLWFGSGFFICQLVYNIWVTTQELVPDAGFMFVLVLQALYVILLLIWPFINRPLPKE